MSNLTKVALVTGAGSGIGRIVALALLEEGYDVVLAGRRQEALDETQALSKSSKGNSLGSFLPDVTDPAAVRDLFAQTERTFGRLDVLFNNAGVGIRRVKLTR